MGKYAIVVALLVGLSESTRSFEKIAAEAKADAAFLDLLDRFTGQSRNVGVTPTSPNYAPTLFAKEGAGFNKRQLEDAMRRLFNSNMIRAEPYGSASNPHCRLARGSSEQRLGEGAVNA
jgi:hypothetical protein